MMAIKKKPSQWIYALIIIVGLAILKVLISANKMKKPLFKILHYPI